MRTATIAAIILASASFLGGCEISSLLDRRCTTDAECSADEICTDAGFCVSEDAFNNFMDGDLPQSDGDENAQPDIDRDPDEYGDSLEFMEIEDDQMIDGDNDADSPESDGQDIEEPDMDAESDAEREEECVLSGFACFANGGVNGNDIGFDCRAGNGLFFCEPKLDYEQCIMYCGCTSVEYCDLGCVEGEPGEAQCVFADGDAEEEIDIELEGNCSDGSFTCAGWDFNHNGISFACENGGWTLNESCNCGPCMDGHCTTACEYSLDHCADETTLFYSDPRPGCCTGYFESCPPGEVCNLLYDGCVDSDVDGDAEYNENGNCYYPETPVCFAAGGIYGNDKGVKCGTDGALYYCSPQLEYETCTKSCLCRIVTECGNGECIDEGNGQAECLTQPDGDDDGGEMEFNDSCTPGRLFCVNDGTNIYQVQCNQDGNGYGHEQFCMTANNPCSEYTCSDDVGCVYTPNSDPCDDGLSCTTNDHCSSGVCKGTAVACPPSPSICKDNVCLEQSGCTLVNNTKLCEDGNLCTVNDRCHNGICRAGSPLVCPSDGNECTQEFCKVDKGCTTQIITGSCDDNLDCTGGDHCENGECMGDPLECAQPDSQCQAAECVEGQGCVVFDLEGSCSDGNACTANDRCSGGVCVPGPALSCPDDGNVCTDEYCDPASGCRSTNNTKPCNDGLGCTQNDICNGGQCNGTPIVCQDDGNVCTDAACVEGSGCVQTNNSKPCNDGRICTTNDKCSGGVCSGSAVVCADDHNSCTTESCVEGTGCQSTPLNGTSCSDSNACTSGDTCVSGVCTGSAINCSDGNSCTQDLCNPASGCSNPPAANGSDCRLNTGGYGECINGQCIPVIICDPGEMVCETSGGTITEKVCSSDGTYWETEICNDNNSCTTNQCKNGVGCFYQNKDNGTPCSEGGSPGQCINATCIVAVDGDSDCPAVPTPLDIPDGTTSGLESYIYKDESGLSQRVCVSVDITHPYIGDLEVRIVAPNGQYKVLHANEGGATDDIHKTYKFLDFFFIQSQGIWTLKVIDNAPGDKGTLDCWSIDTSCWF